MYHIIFAAFLAQATYFDLQQKGHNLLDKGDIKEAEIALKESASLNPQHIPTLKDLGEVYAKLRQFPEAITQYKKVAELNPKDINARGRLAELYSWVGDYDNAIVVLKNSLELDPQNINLKTELAKVLRWSHRYDEAERLYKEILKDAPTNHDAMKGLANTYAMMGDLNAALDMFDKVIILYPGDAELYKEEGTVLAWRKDFNRAITVLSKAVELSPDYAEAYRNMGDIYTWMNDYKKAADSYKKLTGIEPNNIENHLALAHAYMAMGNLTMAEDAAKAALKLGPANSNALELLRKIRESEKYAFTKITGEIIEFSTFVFVFVLIIFVARSKRRMMKRRHRLYFYFINFVIPILVVTTFVSFLGKDIWARWVDTHLIEDITEAVLFFSLGISLLTLLFRERRTHEFMKTIILAIGAHPDDIELGCGAFIMKAKDSGAKVYGLVLTKGEKGTDKLGKREEEFVRAAKFMEMDGFWNLGFQDTELKDSLSQIKGVIEEKIKETGATIVLTHSAIDIHSDHQAVFEATKEAARNISILSYEDVSTPKEFVPNYFVDVTGYIDDKMKLITFHRTQEEKTYMDPEIIKGRAAHRGLQSNVPYAEAFRIHKILR